MIFLLNIQLQENNVFLVLGIWILAVGWNRSNRLPFLSQTYWAALPRGTQQYWCCINMDRWSYIHVQRHTVLAFKPEPPGSGEGLPSKHRHTLDAVWRLSHQASAGTQHEPYPAQWFSVITLRDAYLFGVWRMRRECSTYCMNPLCEQWEHYYYFWTKSAWIQQKNKYLHNALSLFCVNNMLLLKQWLLTDMKWKKTN